MAEQKAAQWVFAMVACWVVRTVAGKAALRVVRLVETRETQLAESSAAQKVAQLVAWKAEKKDAY